VNRGVVNPNHSGNRRKKITDEQWVHQEAKDFTQALDTMRQKSEKEV